MPLDNEGNLLHSASSLMFQVYDATAERWFPPQVMRTMGEAIRSFSAAANTEGNQFNVHAADFTLFCVGEWDDRTGKGKFYDAPKSLNNALTYKRAPESDPRQLEIA